MERTAAKVEDGVVTQVIVGSYEWANSRLGGEWIDTTGTSVGMGYTYLEGEFRSPQPFDSWTWDGESWQPPIPMPDDGLSYMWDETTQEWVEMDFDMSEDEHFDP